MIALSRRWWRGGGGTSGNVWGEGGVAQVSGSYKEICDARMNALVIRTPYIDQPCDLRKDMLGTNLLKSTPCKELRKGTA